MAGLMLIVSATLIDAWSDTRDMDVSQELSIEAARFVDDWMASHELVSEYQLAVGALGSYLADLSHWLEEAESGLRDAGIPTLGDEGGRVKEAYAEIRFPLWLKIADLYEEFERVASKVPPEKLNAHKAYARRVLHPLILCAPFVNIAYSKPSGYAGDHLMLGVLLGENEPEAGSLYGQMVNDFHVNAAISQAYRNRMDALVERLTEVSERAVRKRGVFRVLAVGCGTAGEWDRMLDGGFKTGSCEIDLVDANPVALEAARKRLMDRAGKDGPLKIRTFHRSVDDLLRDGHPTGELCDSVSYDMVYAFSLFDYLPDRIGEKLVRAISGWLRPGGRITLAGVDKGNPNRAQMEHLMEWYLMYRDERALSMMVPSGMKKAIQFDNTGVNMMLDITA
ncbi:MAG: Methyltransferase domain protein [Verrucomicrobia bacterium ADurb.Bin474]|nr:MAG: Methyltransferase domain protein [Verrucomicrobia bacterium ADurb.Bin474]